MDRRTLLRMIAAATGTAFVGSFVMAYEQVPGVGLESTGFTAVDVALLNEIAEVILPRTDTPGAKDANVGQIMAVLVADCYTLDEKACFIDGIKQLQQQCQKEYGKAFLALAADQRLAFLTRLDEEARAYNQQRSIFWVSSKPSWRNAAEQGPLPHFFSLFKQLTLFGFFTSEIGATQALRYVAVPGRYDGDLDYKKGDRAWST